MAPRKLGLVVNPVAGLGGATGLKGSDGADIQRLAQSLGAEPAAHRRAAAALSVVRARAPQVELITYPDEMGATAARLAGYSPRLVGQIEPGHTTPDDTVAAAQALASQGVDLLLFAGGDGTARDIYRAVGDRLPVLGIPAGVKIHSAVYTIHPTAAGELAAAYLNGEVSELREAEVMDLDETLYRQGVVAPQLFGYLRIPYRSDLVQGRKTPTRLSDRAAVEAIAQDVIDNMDGLRLEIIGPGTTTRPILTRLGLPKTLIGIDVLQGGQLVKADANERDLLQLLEGQAARIVVTPIGGQGHIFGRGNQQLSPAVLRRAGPGNILVVCPFSKLLTLSGRPLRVDTGDLELDRALCGFRPVITGYRERMMYRVDC